MEEKYVTILGPALIVALGVVVSIRLLIRWVRNRKR